MKSIQKYKDMSKSPRKALGEELQQSPSKSVLLVDDCEVLCVSTQVLILSCAEGGRITYNFTHSDRKIKKENWSGHSDGKI